MKGLTPRQSEILAFIGERLISAGRPPTRAEIAQQFGFRSANAAEDHLQALAKKGYILLDASTSRGIRLTEEHTRQHEAGPLDTFSNIFQLPLIGRVAAGSPLLAQEHVEARFGVEIGLFTERPDYLLKVRGLSMIGIGILDGDLLAVKKTDTAREGQIVVARINDEVTVKRYTRLDGQIRLLAENPDFKPIVINQGHDDFAIEGLGVGLLRTTPLN
ncbi:MAG: transcriptional repressor LexA [Burkholderiaceae bacterium]|jgi:repressor LexA